jgi:glycosyltransferase involved in cell wall biosynthesis
MQTPKISIIIPVYNTDKYLDKCLESVTAQTLKEIEIICVNDGSTDNSLEILKKYAKQDSRFIIIDQNDSGAGAARNVGLDKAQGEYLAFLDSDDFFELDMLEKMYKKAKNDDADILLCDYFAYNNKTKKRERRFINAHLLKNLKIFSSKDMPDDIFLVAGTENWSRLYKKSFILDNKIRFQNLKTCNDVYFALLSLALAQKIVYIDQPFVNYRQKTGAQIVIRGLFFESIFIAFDKLKNVLIEKDIFDSLKNSFYDKFVSCLRYEYQFIKEKNKKAFLEQCKKQLPEKYFKKFTEKESGKFIKNLFSIRNIYTDGNKVKILTFLNLKIKLGKR